MTSRSPRAVRMIQWYQRAFDGRLSPCRFSPSCSSYALEAFDTHGTGRGAYLTVRRLVRCRPFGPSGWDPVPPASGPQDADLRSDTSTSQTMPCQSMTCQTMTSQTMTSQKGC